MSQPFQAAAILFVILFVDWNVKNINFWITTQGYSGDGDEDEGDSFSDEEDGDDDDDDGDDDDDDDDDDEEEDRLGNNPEDEDDHGVDGKFTACWIGKFEVKII